MSDQKQVLVATHAALANAFGSKSRDLNVSVTSHHSELKEKMEQGLTSSDLDTIVREIGGKSITTSPPKVIDIRNQPNAIPFTKNIEESRKLIDTFNNKLKNYPKVLTYEGSVVLCVAISVNEGNGINLNGLPQIDREVVLSQLPSDASSKMASFESHLDVEFDDTKDFVLIYRVKDSPPLKLHFFNTVIHPQKLSDTNVPVEKDGGKVMVGNAMVLDQKRIQKLAGNIPVEQSHRENEDELPRRQPISGRNAFELRTDLIEMSMNLLIHNNKGNISPEDIVKTAKVLYTFVENRR